MSKLNTVVAIFKSHVEAEAAIKELVRVGIDMKKLSIAGRGDHEEEHAVYQVGERMKYWGKVGAFWGWIWGLFFGSALFWVPGFGPLVIAGQMVGITVGAIEGAAVVGGFSALLAGLYSLGIPKDAVQKYEAELKAGKFLLVYHGEPQDAAQVHEILHQTEVESLHHHH